MYALAACDLTESDDLVWDIARHLPSIKWVFQMAAPMCFPLLRN